MMLRLLRFLALSAAVVLCLSGTADAIGTSLGIHLQTNTNLKPIGVSAPAGTPTALTVLSNGWQAQVRLAQTTCGTSLAAYSLTPDATPKLTLAVTSPSYTTAGAVTTISRNVYGTIPLRQPFANNTLSTETQSGADCVVTVALSDFVNVNDTASATLLSGAYTGSLANASLAVTNNSSQAHPPPICNWVTPPHQVIAPGSSFTVEVVCGHARPQNSKEVQAVIFDTSDGTNHATCSSTSMSRVNALVTTGNPIQGFSCTYSAGAFAGLTAGSCAAGASCEVTMDFTAYTIVGDAKLVASAGQDGVAIAASARTSNLHAQNFVFDQASKYSPVYGWICAAGNDATNGCTAGATGTCATNGCISTSVTDPGKGVTLNYASVKTFGTNCQSYNNANRGHNDTAGCVGFVRKIAAMNGYDPTTSLTTLTPGLSWMTIKAAPGESNTTVVVNPASSSTGNTDVNDRTWLENIGFAQRDATSAGYNSFITGNDHAVSTFSVELVCNLCAPTTFAASGWPAVYGVGLIHWYNSTITQTGGAACGLVCGFSTDHWSPTFMGGTMNLVQDGSLHVWPYTILGVQFTGGSIFSPGTLANCVTPTGIFIGFNSVYHSTVPVLMKTNGVLGCFPSANVAEIQNVFEKTTVDGGTAQNLLADSDETPISNLVEQYNTFAGGRENLCYNDGTGPTGVAKSTAKSCIRMYNLLDPMASQGENIKSDTFVTANSARIGNWPVRFGVGSVGTVFNQSADNSVAPPSSFMGDYMGLTGSTTANNEPYGQSGVAFTTNASASGTNAGGGNYKPSGTCSASPAYGRVYSGMAGLPSDITGAARRNDGTGAAGANEC